MTITRRIVTKLNNIFKKEKVVTRENVLLSYLELILYSDCSLLYVGNETE